MIHPIDFLRGEQNLHGDRRFDAKCSSAGLSLLPQLHHHVFYRFALVKEGCVKVFVRFSKSLSVEVLLAARLPILSDASIIWSKIQQHYRSTIKFPLRFCSSTRRIPYVVIPHLRCVAFLTEVWTMSFIIS